MTDLPSTPRARAIDRSLALPLASVILAVLLPPAYVLVFDAHPQLRDLWAWPWAIYPAVATANLALTALVLVPLLRGLARWRTPNTLMAIGLGVLMMIGLTALAFVLHPHPDQWRMFLAANPYWLTFWWGAGGVSAGVYWGLRRVLNR